MTTSASEVEPTDGGDQPVVSAEELQDKAAEVQELREEVNRVEAERLSREAALSNQIAMADLETEEARLRARLAQAKAATEAATQTSPLTSAKEQMEAAVNQQKAAEAASEGKVFDPETGDTKAVEDPSPDPSDEAEDAPTDAPDTPTVRSFGDPASAPTNREGSAL